MDNSSFSSVPRDSLADSQLSPSPPVTEFTTIEGLYSLRDDIRYEVPLHECIGSWISFISTRQFAPETETFFNSAGPASQNTSVDYDQVCRIPASYSDISVAGDGVATVEKPSGFSALMGGGKSSTRLKKGVKSPIFGATSSSNTPPTSSSSSSSAGSNNGTASAEKSGNNSPSNNNSSSSYNYHHNNSNINNIISRIQIHDNIAKLISFRSPTTTYMFVNFGRVLLWLDYDLKPNDPLSLITFKDSVIITCHDANLMLKDTMDLVVGFNSGDIMLYSPVSCKWQRFNRQGMINKSCVTCVKWLPGSETVFMVAHEDGSIFIYDREKEDQPFIHVNHNQHENPILKPKSQKYNPLSCWSFTRKSITAISFSPDHQHVAVASQDGCLRIVDYHNERVIDTYKSYFGGLTCAAWSPDGRLIIAGGQDDLISIYNFRGRIIARCQGHSSWVTSVAFDPYKCTDRSYRFASVAEDTKLCLWDFSASALFIPKLHQSSSTLRRSRVELHHTVHPVSSRTEVAILNPVVIISLHADPLVGVGFREDSIVTSDRLGFVKIWKRPIEE